MTIALAFACVTLCRGQQPTSPLSTLVPHRYLVVYRNSAIPTNSNARVADPSAMVSVIDAASGSAARIIHTHPSLGVAVIQTSPDSDDALTLAALRAQPSVEYVLHDRVVSAHSLRLRPMPATIGVAIPTPAPPPRSAPYDTFYNSPQGWAVRQAGGYGAGVPGGPMHGPWDTTLGAGVRIAILDSGVDENHPDIAPNLGFNLSEIDQSPNSGLPSPCDDGTPQDQQGHGTWTASLAAGAMGPNTGEVIGVAPAATILNIKVLERLPDPSAAGANLATQCATGEASGLLSWVLQGIEDAVRQRADVISLSLGALVDLNTGEGAGLLATFNRVTYAAGEAGAVLIASAGNDGLSLADPRFVEIPAQSRDVLAVVASTNPDCAEQLIPGASCVPGPVTLAYYSNSGAPLNAIAAPGGSYPAGATNDVSGWVRGACSAGIANTSDGPPSDSSHSLGCFSLGHVQYVQAMGTSASAPLVAGAAALLRAAHPAWTPAQVIGALRSTATATASLPAAPILNLAALFP